jgi:hypothetical protein
MKTSNMRTLLYWNSFYETISENNIVDNNDKPTDPKEFAEKFYIYNLIRLLKKNPKITDFIGVDGSIKEMPGVCGGCRAKIPEMISRFENGTWDHRYGFRTHEEYIKDCKGKVEYEEAFEQYKCIPLAVFLEELIKILGLDPQNWDRNSKTNTLSYLLSELYWDYKPAYWETSWVDKDGRKKSNLREKEGKCHLVVFKVNTKENPKENLRYIIFDKLSKGIPKEKAEEIYKKYKNQPTAEVEPKNIFVLTK